MNSRYPYVWVEYTGVVSVEQPTLGTGTVVGCAHPNCDKPATRRTLVKGQCKMWCYWHVQGMPVKEPTTLRTWSET